MIAAGVRFDDAGIDRKGFTFDQTRVHARPHYRLEYLALSRNRPWRLTEKVDACSTT